MAWCAHGRGKWREGTWGHILDVSTSCASRSCIELSTVMACAGGGRRKARKATLARLSDVITQCGLEARP